MLTYYLLSTAYHGVLHYCWSCTRLQIVGSEAKGFDYQPLIDTGRAFCLLAGGISRPRTARNVISPHVSSSLHLLHAPNERDTTKASGIYSSAASRQNDLTTDHSHSNVCKNSECSILSLSISIAYDDDS